MPAGQCVAMCLLSVKWILTEIMLRDFMISGIVLNRGENIPTWTKKRKTKDKSEFTLPII